MGIGIGGGLGPFRAGISTRGVGGGVGPLSVGSSWGRRGSSDAEGCGLLLGLCLALAAVCLVFAWPFLLGAWISEKLGAENPSTTRTVVGWIFESVWLALILLVAAAVLVETVKERRHRARVDAYYAEHGAELAELVQVLDTGPHVSAMLTELLGEMDSSAGLLSGSEPTSFGTPLGRAPARLVAPRVPLRGMPPVQTAVDDGYVTVTGEAVQFSGEAKSTRWLHKKTTNRRRTDQRLLIDVSTRATVMGIESPEPALDYVDVLTEYAMGVADRDEAVERLRTLRGEVQALVDDWEEHLAVCADRLAVLGAAAPVLEGSSSPDPGPDESGGVGDPGPLRALPEVQVTSPPPPGGAKWSPRTERAFRGAAPAFRNWLAPDERLVAVIRVNKIFPALSLLAVTDQRVIACDSSPPTDADPPVSLARSSIVDVEVSGFMDAVAISTTDGAVHKLGSIMDSEDVELFKHALGYPG